MIIDLFCRGVTPILFNRLSESVLEGLRTKVKKPKAANIGQTITPREEAAPKYYSHGGRPIIPGEMLMASLIGAGVFVRLDAKRQVSTAKSTVLPGLMTLQDHVLFLVDPDDVKKVAAWEPDVRRGVNPNGGEAVAVVRARFDRWAFAAKIDIEENEIGENAIRQLWDFAGRRTGLGDFRPSRKGIFGKFVVDKWVRVEGRAQAAAE